MHVYQKEFEREVTQTKNHTYHNKLNEDDRVSQLTFQKSNLCVGWATSTCHRIFITSYQLVVLRNNCVSYSDLSFTVVAMETILSSWDDPSLPYHNFMKSVSQSEVTSMILLDCDSIRMQQCNALQWQWLILLLNVIVLA